MHFQTSTTIDTLDYSASGLNAGSKVVLAAVGPPGAQIGIGFMLLCLLRESQKVSLTAFAWSSVQDAETYGLSDLNENNADRPGVG